MDPGCGSIMTLWTKLILFNFDILKLRMEAQPMELPPEEPGTTDGTLAALSFILDNLPENCSPRALAQVEASGSKSS